MKFLKDKDSNNRRCKGSEVSGKKITVILKYPGLNFF